LKAWPGAKTVRLRGANNGYQNPLISPSAASLTNRIGWACAASRSPGDRIPSVGDYKRRSFARHPATNLHTGAHRIVRDDRCMKKGDATSPGRTTKKWRPKERFSIGKIMQLCR